MRKIVFLVLFGSISFQIYSKDYTPATPGTTQTKSVHCTYFLFTWVKDVLLPTLKLFNIYIKDLKNAHERMTTRRLIDWYNRHSQLIDEGIKTLEKPSPDKEKYLANNSEIYTKLIESMKSIQHLLLNVMPNTGRMDYKALSAQIEIFEKDLDLVEKSAAILSLNKITKKTAVVPIPPNFKGWLDIRPYCNNILSATQKMTVDPEATEFELIKTPSQR